MFESLIYYKILYYFILTAALIIRLCRKDISKKEESIIYLIIISSFAILMGFRPLGIGPDTQSYCEQFERVQTLGFHDVATLKFGRDSAFYILLWIIGLFANVHVAFGVISGLFTFLCFYFSKSLYKDSDTSNALILFIFLMYGFTTFNCEINIIRAGLAMGLWALFTLTLYRQQIAKSMLFGLLAVFTHFSTSAFIILSLIACCFQWKILYSGIAVFIAAGLAALGFSVLNIFDFKIFGVPEATYYTTDIEQFGYKTGFRQEFVLFNFFFLTIPLFFRKNLDRISEYYVRLYTLCTILFFLWFTIPYSDRIGSYGWFLIPVIVYMPLARKFGYKSPVVWGSCMSYGLLNFCI